jgi:hypothetical protein
MEIEDGVAESKKKQRRSRSKDNLSSNIKN